MAKKTTTKEVEVVEKTIETNTEFAKLLEIYKAQSPKKYALKEAELTRKLQANK
jgi:hypothetical protein